MKTIRECLMKMTVSELTNLGFRLMVNPPEKKHLKAPWCDTIEEFYQHHMEQILPCISVESLQAYTQLCQSHRNPQPIEHISFSDCNKKPELQSLLIELQTMGLSWRDAYSWHIQQEATSVLNLQNNKLNELEQLSIIHDMLDGFMQYYGLIQLHDLYQKIDFDCEEDFFLFVWRCRHGFHGIVFMDNEVWFTSPYADWKKILQARQEPEATKFDYREITAEHALHVSDTCIPGREEDYRWIRGYLLKNSDCENENDIDMLLSDIIHITQQGDVDEAIELLSSAMENMPSPHDIQNIGKFIQHIPRWQLKGHCAAEISVSREVKQQPSQNDPCPCGSGKKYKNCCGQFH